MSDWQENPIDYFEPQCTFHPQSVDMQVDTKPNITFLVHLYNWVYLLIEIPMPTVQQNNRHPEMTYNKFCKI